MKAKKPLKTSNNKPPCECPECGCKEYHDEVWIWDEMQGEYVKLDPDFGIDDALEFVRNED